MVLMFAAGIANLFWMVATLTALMVYGKTGRAGRGFMPCEHDSRDAET
jgi:predicted metal-binding membrane protein